MLNLEIKLEAICGQQPMQGIYGLTLTEIQRRVFNLLKQQPVNLGSQLLHLRTQAMQLFDESEMSMDNAQAPCPTQRVLKLLHASTRALKHEKHMRKLP